MVTLNIDGAQQEFKSIDYVDAKLDELYPHNRIISGILNYTTIPGVRMTRMPKPTAKQLDSVLLFAGFDKGQIRKMRVWMRKAQLVQYWLAAHESLPFNYGLAISSSVAVSRVPW